MADEHCFFWFRRDLRVEDNCGLFHALISGKKVIPVFILDKNILDDLQNKTDRRVAFILEKLNVLQQNFREFNSDLVCIYNTPELAWKELFHQFGSADIYTNRDYEPYAIKRDATIAFFAKNSGSHFHEFKDQVIFERNEILKDNGLPYTVFTPYSKKWKALFKPTDIQEYPSESEFKNLLPFKTNKIPQLSEIGFNNSNSDIPQMNISKSQISEYGKTRDFPGVPGITKVSTVLRFGTISIRSLFRTAEAIPNSNEWKNELIWREFFSQILWHFPEVVTRSFKTEYESIPWRNDETEFQKWCGGKTGYPLVDAGMRELNQTGFMHNRVRMVVASFLTKHLLIDWRWGEAYFAEKLLDYDLASNNGNWQWAAGCGADAVPYFRIFNPSLQAAKFDPDKIYIRKWVPEIDTLSYPSPMVSHELARDRCLKTYKAALNRG